MFAAATAENLPGPFLFILCISPAILCSGIYGISDQVTSISYYMIVKATNNGQEYRLGFSTICKYFYNIDDMN